MIVLLDAGHGGVIDGEYVTPGKRSPKWADGSQYFEGVGNRQIRRILAYLLDQANIPYHFVSTGNKDVDLDDRAKVVNAFCEAYGVENCLLVSIHSNGHDNGSAHGWEVFTTKGQTKSDAYATLLYEEMEAEFPNMDFRVDTTDGDVDKESNFYILRKSACPAILSENFFHTNEFECKNILMSQQGQLKIARAHFRMIHKAINYKR